MAAHSGPGLSGNTISVTTSPTELAGRASYHRTVAVKNVSAGIVYLGGDTGLTTANGYELSAGEAFSIDLAPAAELHAIAGSSLEVRVLIADGISSF